MATRWRQRREAAAASSSGGGGGISGTTAGASTGAAASAAARTTPQGSALGSLSLQRQTRQVWNDAYRQLTAGEALGAEGLGAVMGTLVGLSFPQPAIPASDCGRMLSALCVAVDPSSDDVARLLCSFMSTMMSVQQVQLSHDELDGALEFLFAHVCSCASALKGAGLKALSNLIHTNGDRLSKHHDRLVKIVLPFMEPTAPDLMAKHEALNCVGRLFVKASSTMEGNAATALFRSLLLNLRQHCQPQAITGEDSDASVTRVVATVLRALDAAIASSCTPLTPFIRELLQNLRPLLVAGLARQAELPGSWNDAVGGEAGAGDSSGAAGGSGGGGKGGVAGARGAGGAAGGVRGGGGGPSGAGAGASPARAWRRSGRRSLDGLMRWDARSSRGRQIEADNWREAAPGGGGGGGGGDGSGDSGMSDGDWMATSCSDSDIGSVRSGGNAGRQRIQTALSKIRAAAMRCLLAVAQSDPKLLHGHWAILLPCDDALTLIRDPNAPSLVTVALYDPSLRARTAAVATITAMLAAAPLPRWLPQPQRHPHLDPSVAPRSASAASGAGAGAGARDAGESKKGEGPRSPAITAGGNVRGSPRSGGGGGGGGSGRKALLAASYTSSSMQIDCILRELHQVVAVVLGQENDDMMLIAYLRLAARLLEVTPYPQLPDRDDAPPATALLLEVLQRAAEQLTHSDRGVSSAAVLVMSAIMSSKHLPTGKDLGLYFFQAPIHAVGASVTEGGEGTAAGGGGTGKGEGKGDAGADRAAPSVALSPPRRRRPGEEVPPLTVASGAGLSPFARLVLLALYDLRGGAAGPRISSASPSWRDRSSPAQSTGRLANARGRGLVHDATSKPGGLGSMFGSTTNVLAKTAMQFATLTGHQWSTLNPLLVESFASRDQAHRTQALKVLVAMVKGGFFVCPAAAIEVGAPAEIGGAVERTNEIYELWGEVLRMHVVRALHDTASAVRVQACECFADLQAAGWVVLGAEGRASLLNALLQLAGDRVTAVRGASFRAMGRLALLEGLDEEKVKFMEPACRALCDRSNDDNLGVRVKVSWALANICSLLAAEQERTGERDAAGGASGEILGPDRINALFDTLLRATRDHEKVKANAVRGLGRLGQTFVVTKQWAPLGLAASGLTETIRNGASAKTVWNACHAAREIFTKMTVLPATTDEDAKELDEASSPDVLAAAAAVASAAKPTATSTVKATATSGAVGDLASVRAWASSLLYVLAEALQCCPNFKVRASAALALMAPRGEVTALFAVKQIQELYHLVLGLLFEPNSVALQEAGAGGASDVGGVGAKVETPKKDQAMFKQKFQDQLVELFVYVTPLFSDSVWCDAALEPSEEVVDRLDRFGEDVFYMLQRYIRGLISGWEEIIKCGLIHL